MGFDPSATLDDSDEQAILDMDESNAEVGFLTGMVNHVTVVGVHNAVGQGWMDSLKLQPGARMWTPAARYYLFDYIEATESDLAAKCAVPGLRIQNDGDWIPYSGNIMDGHLVH